MSNITAKINLRYLKSAVRKMKGQSGEIECLIIPIKENSLIQGEKGIYLDLVAFELKTRNEDQKNTHLVKQSFPKDVFEKMTEQQKKDTPIIGSLTVWGYYEKDPENFPVEPLPPASNGHPYDPMEGDLPF